VCYKECHRSVSREHKVREGVSSGGNSGRTLFSMLSLESQAADAAGVHSRPDLMGGMGNGVVSFAAMSLHAVPRYIR
jgi:hypothetical protein